MSRKKHGYRLCDLAKEGPFGRSKLHELIKDGHLPARKCGHSTIILADDFDAFLRNLPERRIWKPPKAT